MNKIYTDYAVLDAQIKELEAKKEGMRVAIINEMLESRIEKIETGVGSFSITKLKKWSYTDKVEELNQKYKARKALEESCGDATYIEVESLRFNSIKL